MHFVKCRAINLGNDPHPDPIPTPNPHVALFALFLSLSLPITQTNILLVAQWEHCPVDTRGLTGRSDHTVLSAPDVVTRPLTRSNILASCTHEKVSVMND